MSRLTRLRAGTAISAGLLVLLAACGGGSSGGSSASGGNSNCKPAHKVSTIKSGTLTVGVYDLPPYASTTGPGGMSGVDADIVREIAKQECLSVTPQPEGAASIVPSVQQGRVDVGIGDWYRTVPRSKVVKISAPLYLDQMGIISKEGYSQVSQLQGKSVGTVEGYLWVQDLQKVLGGSLRLYPSSVNLDQDLKAGRIAVAVDSYGSLLHTEKNSGLKIEVAKPDPRVAASQEPAQAGLPIDPHNDSLLTAADAVINEMHQNGKIAAILKANGLPESAANVGQPRLVS
jgi:polar amino acid transport system substrate-binding protein